MIVYIYLFHFWSHCSKSSWHIKTIPRVGGYFWL